MAVAISNIIISIFGHVTVIGFNIWCRVPNFIKIGRFFTEIWRYNDFQNGGRPPSWILKIFSFCHAAFVGMPFCFRIQNFAKIRQSVDELWPKKRFSRWRSPPSWIPKISIFGHVTVTGFNIWCRVPNFIKIGLFYRAMRCKRGLCCHAVSVCLSVRPSVTFVDHVKTNKHIFEIFSPSGSDTILVLPPKGGADIPTGTLLTGASNARGYDKMTIFSQISRCISETVIVRWAHAARQFVSIGFSFHPYNT